MGGSLCAYLVRQFIGKGIGTFREDCHGRVDVRCPRKRERGGG